jgi:KipI family sensor histidine kinase inhibitor
MSGSRLDHYPCVVAFGEAALLVEFADQPDLRANMRVRALEARLRASPPPGLRNLIPGMVSLLVEFDPFAADVSALEQRVHEELAPAAQPDFTPGRLRTLPTVYGGQFGPDLDDVAKSIGLSADEVIRRHAAAEVTVYMIGFSPGYPYMGLLPAEFALPRRTTPRDRIPPGSVAIAERMTSIYTRATPGGWHIIGRTPAVLFDESRDPPAYLAPGDRVRHVPILASAWPKQAGAALDW